ncbi:MAG: AAA family ATPase, partial [Chloroflexi bacterium]|nr:AAA family ATPase [Chloroflexota bacterium]
MDNLLERQSELATIEVLLDRGGVLIVEGRAGIGKTSLVDVACRRADAREYEVLSARGSELEADFAFGVVRQLFERRLLSAEPAERAALLAGPAAAVRPLLFGQPAELPASDTSFAVMHGLYWLAANLAARRPLLIAVDDAHWADEPSLRGLAYLASRLEGLALALLVALRPGEPASIGAPLLALRSEAATVLRPTLLSEGAVGSVVRGAAGARATDALCRALYTASGGNPLYLTEVLRALELDHRTLAELDPNELLVGSVEGIARHVVARARRLAPHALELAQALAVLGDDCALRHAAGIAGVAMDEAARLAAGLVRLEVLAAAAPPRFIHPVIRTALEASLSSDERDAAHRAAARLLHGDGAPSGQVAAHLLGVHPAGDEWVLARLEEAAQAALDSGAPRAAAGLLGRALAEPPPVAQRVRILRAAARAEASAGHETACLRLEEALRLVAEPRERAEIALEVAEVYAALFRWVDAVDVLDRALVELGEADDALAARLEGELVVAGMHDARRAARVEPTLTRLAGRQRAAPSEALVVAHG